MCGDPASERKRSICSKALKSKKTYYVRLLSVKSVLLRGRGRRMSASSRTCDPLRLADSRGRGSVWGNVGDGRTRGQNRRPAAKRGGLAWPPLTSRGCWCQSVGARGRGLARHHSSKGCVVPASVVREGPLSAPRLPALSLRDPVLFAHRLRGGWQESPGAGRPAL